MRVLGEGTNPQLIPDAKHGFGARTPFTLAFSCATTEGWDAV
jgi:hypothetical protein